MSADPLPDPALARGRVTRASSWTADGVEVVVPRGFALREVEPFVEEKRPWIERTLRRMRESEAELPPARLEDGGEVPYLGERLRLRCGSSPAGRASTWRAAASVLEVALPDRRGAVRAALERWYRRRARARWRRASTPPAPARARAYSVAPDPRPAHPLGVVLVERGDELQLAAAARAAGDPRLRGRARGGAPRGARPLRALLDAAGGRAAPTGASASAGCAATGTRCGSSASTQLAGWQPGT